MNKSSDSRRGKRKEGPKLENGDDSDSSSSSCANKTKRSSKIRKLGVGGESCHQCHRSDKGRVINCNKCRSKRYCLPCISKYYPELHEKDFVKACPFCRDICNCKSCLNSELPIKSTTPLSKEDKFHHSIYLLKRLLPFVRQFNEEQIMERKMEAKIRGSSISDVKVQAANCPVDERLYCNYCRATIVDYHRSCNCCSYDLCITCCQELRDCCLHRLQEDIMQYADPGVGYLHGGKRNPPSNGTIGTPAKTKDGAHIESEPKWKANKDGSISCPPESLGGCGKGVLKLNQVLPEDWVPNMLVEAEKLYQLFELKHMPETHAQWCSYFDSACDNIVKTKLRKAALRDNLNDNYLYSPSAKDIQEKDLKHFQAHWSRGEPVIVSNVLASTYGLSWEPETMSRAMREMQYQAEMAVINCLNWCENAEAALEGQKCEDPRSVYDLVSYIDGGKDGDFKGSKKSNNKKKNRKKKVARKNTSAIHAPSSPEATSSRNGIENHVPSSPEATFSRNEIENPVNDTIEKSYIWLQFSDGTIQEVEEEVACLCPTLCAEKKSGGFGTKKENPVCLPPEVNSASLALVLDYCRFHQEPCRTNKEHNSFDAKFLRKNTDNLSGLLAAARYLEMDVLIDQICSAMADKLNEGPSEKLHAFFNNQREETRRELWADRKVNTRMRLLKRV